MEMTNPEVRRELREMLEFQMRERDQEMQNDDQMSGYQRKRHTRYSNDRLHPVPPRTIQQSVSQKLLPRSTNDNERLPPIRTSTPTGPQQRSMPFAGLHNQQNSYGGVLLANPTTPE